MVGVQMKGYEGCIETERRGLLEIKAFVVSQGQDGLASWVDDKASNCCLWKRVKCNNSTNHVTELSLDALYIFQLDIWMLNISLLRPFRELLSLNLSWNWFEGWTDNGAGFQSLKKLQTLDLSGNYLKSNSLSSFGTLTSLRTLKLGSNLIDHFIFTQLDFANFSKLEILDLSDNELNGSLDALGFQSLKKLQTLDLSRNYLKRINLSSLGALTSLRTLKLDGNLIDHFIFAQSDFANFSKLEILDLSNNKLNGSLDAPGLCKLRNLAELGLRSNTLSGQISECIGNLTNLQVLDLSHNFFTGNFSFFSNLLSLRYLSLADALIDGFFPLSSLANLSKLEILQLSTESINGLQVETENPRWVPLFQLKILMLRRCNLNVIPSFLLHQYDLEGLDLSHNKIVGNFPSWLLQNNSRLDSVNLRNNSFFGSLELSSVVGDINRLDVSNNNISGQLPIDFGLLLPTLFDLNLSINGFESTIPSSFCEMKYLLVLDLSYNHFYGHLPMNLSMGCIHSLQFLKLSNNFLHGQFMPESSKLDTLRWLYLSNNKFNGTMDGLVKNNNLVVVDISKNSIFGSIPSSITKLSYLRALLISENQLQGKIPFGLFQIEALAVLDLSHNNLTGSIPHLNLPSLRSLYLQKNALHGSIPPTLSKSSMLTTIDLRDNKISGSIPRWINKLSNLRVLLLAGNQLQGQIPAELCQLHNVSIMDLSRNKLWGSIPSCLHNMSFGVVEDDDNGVNFERLTVGIILFGSYATYVFDANISVGDIVHEYVGDSIQIEVEFRTKGNFYSYQGNILAYMSGLDLSSNELDGEIPVQIGNFQQIHALNLSHNHFSGSIPKSFSNLTQIESLDLSFNNLSGRIPFELSQLNSLAIFNVSYNNLSGTTPSSGQFANFDEANYRGNPGLCGLLLKKKCNVTNVAPFPAPFVEGRENETWIDFGMFYWSFVGTFVTTVLALVVILLINAQWRRAWFCFIERCLYWWFPLY